MPTTRAETFSDAVFAIAITLLVLDLKVPNPAAGGLGDELTGQWPSYTAYALSFLTIGIVWINHHAQFARLERIDHWLLMLNLLVLLTVAVVPFPTAVMARYLKAGSDQELAVALYAGAILAMGVTYLAIWEYAARRELLGDRLTPAAKRRLLRRNLVGPCLYGLGVAVAFLNPYASLALLAVGGLYYLLPGRWDV